MAKKQKELNKEITLTLSGGGIRTAASLGVIKYLEENNYTIKKNIWYKWGSNYSFAVWIWFYN